MCKVCCGNVFQEPLHWGRGRNGLAGHLRKRQSDREGHLVSSSALYACAPDYTCTQPTYTYISTQKRCTSEPGYDRKVPERGKPFQRLKSLPGFLSSRRGSLPVLPDSRRQEASHKAYVWKCQPLARCVGVKVSGDILTQGHRPSAMAQLSAPPQVRIRQAAGTILPCFHPSEWKQTWRALTWLGRRFPLKRQLLKLVGCGLELQFITVSLIPLPRQKTEHSTYISRPVRGNKV